MQENFLFVRQTILQPRDFYKSIASFFTDYSADCIGGSEMSTSVIAPSMPM